MHVDIPSEQKLSLLRRYPWEVMICLLFGWSVYQTVEVSNLRKTVEKMQVERATKMESLIKESNRVIEKNNILFETIIQQRRYEHD